jgi:hypothetical protein
MSDLGLFTASNPVTYSDPLAAYIAAHAKPADGTCDFPGTVLVTSDTRATLEARRVPKVTLDELAYGLPPELNGRGLIPAREWPKTHNNPNDKKAAGSLFCNASFYQINPYVDPARGAALFRDGRGKYYFGEHPCMVGYDKNPWARWDIDGGHICDLYQSIRLPDSTLQDLLPPTIDPLAQFGNSPMATLDRVRRGAQPGLSIAGVNLQDVLSVVNTLTGGGSSSVDLQGVLAILAALVSQGGRIRDSLTDIPAQLVPGFLNIGDIINDRLPGLGLRLANALADQTAAARATAGDQSAVWAAVAAAAMPQMFGSLAGAVGGILPKLADVYKSALDALIGGVLALFRDDIEASAPVTPANVHKVAAAALRSALTAGSVAQLAGMGLELLHPLKQMGVQQAIGVIAEFAGFGEIAKPYFGATLRYGIGLPAEHRAAAHFRSVLPPVGDVKVLAAKGIIGADKYRDRLILAGYPDPFPEAMLADLYTELSPRALSAFTDGSEADRPWLAAKLRYAGLSPEDTDKVVTALEKKATQPGRTRLTAVLLDDYKQGRLAGEELDTGLQGAGLSPTHRRVWRQVADLERRSYRMELIAAEVLNQYKNDLVGPEAARQLLTALGFAADEVTARLTVGDLKRGLKQVQDEDKAIEAEIRQLKARGLANATRQLRAGFLPLEQFLAVGQGMGYDRAYLQNAAELAYLQGPPSSTNTAPAIGLGALKETQGRLAALIAEQVKLKRTDRVSALVALLQFGFPQDLGELLVAVGEAIAGPTPFAGEFGMPSVDGKADLFTTVAREVTAGLEAIKSPADTIVAQIVQRLGLPSRDRAALTRLIRDVRDLFRL